MHSSRMRTARRLGGGLSAQGGGVCPGEGVSARGVSAQVGVSATHPCEQNDRQV